MFRLQFQIFNPKKIKGKQQKSITRWLRLEQNLFRAKRLKRGFESKAIIVT